MGQLSYSIWSLVCAGPVSRLPILIGSNPTPLRRAAVKLGTFVNQPPYHEDAFYFRRLLSTYVRVFLKTAIFYLSGLAKLLTRLALTRS